MNWSVMNAVAVCYEWSVMNGSVLNGHPAEHLPRYLGGLAADKRTRSNERRRIRAVGTLQTCAGLESGIEAATHAVRKSYEEEGSECLLLADADNAFNKLNRKVSPENKRLCPPMHTYLHISYNTPTMLYLENGDHILSQEGVTQGDNTAMAMYTNCQDRIQTLHPDH